ncbi:MAG: OmpA family protein [Tepidisphaeraceae bacterium]
MSRKFAWLGVAAASVSLTGCVSQEKYNALKLDRDRCVEQLAQAQTESATARSEADAYKEQLGAVMTSGDTKDAAITNLTAMTNELQTQLREINDRYAEAIGMVGRSSPLPASLVTELTSFAGLNKDLLDFDPARGMVKFKSDVTFASGSAELTPKAREAIAKLAKILTSQHAAGYELMVAGHTDNVRVARGDTVRAGHKDNWYLSAHRAITVAGDLRGAKVSAERIAVVGYADQRPVAPNTTDSGRSKNRRVEVVILPTKATKPTFATGDTRPTTKPAAATSTSGDFRGDTTSAETDHGPVFTK